MHVKAESRLHCLNGCVAGPPSNDPTTMRITQTPFTCRRIGQSRVSNSQQCDSAMTVAWTLSSPPAVLVITISGETLTLRLSQL